MRRGADTEADQHALVVEEMQRKLDDRPSLEVEKRERGELRAALGAMLVRGTNIRQGWFDGSPPDAGVMQAQWMAWAEDVVRLLKAAHREPDVQVFLSAQPSLSLSFDGLDALQGRIVTALDERMKWVRTMVARLDG